MKTIIVITFLIFSLVGCGDQKSEAPSGGTHPTSIPSPADDGDGPIAKTYTVDEVFELFKEKEIECNEGSDPDAIEFYMPRVESYGINTNFLVKQLPDDTVHLLDENYYFFTDQVVFINRSLWHRTSESNDGNWLTVTDDSSNYTTGHWKRKGDVIEVFEEDTLITKIKIVPLNNERIEFEVLATDNHPNESVRGQVDYDGNGNIIIGATINFRDYSDQIDLYRDIIREKCSTK